MDRPVVRNALIIAGLILAILALVKLSGRISEFISRLSSRPSWVKFWHYGAKQTSVQSEAG